MQTMNENEVQLLTNFRKMAAKNQKFVLDYSSVSALEDEDEIPNPRVLHDAPPN